MVDFGEMHGLTAVFIVLELMMFSVQLHFYLIWPYDKRRLAYLVLLVLLIGYNVTGGFFPDPDIRWLSIPLQNIIAYGSGFLMSAYFPYYFYISFDLKSLRLHALYGTSTFLLLPYFLFFVILYPISGNLEFAVNYGLIIPALYSPVLLYAMFAAIQLRFSRNSEDTNPYTRVEMLAVYGAVSPWVFMSLFAYLQVPQWVEALFTNTGFVIIAVLFLYQSGKYERNEKKRQIERDAMDEKQKADFNQTCKDSGLSTREAEVALMLCQGREYKSIALILHISARTVDTHAHRIYYKLDVKNKIELQQKLGFAG
ncbi:regulatory protein, luxR family [Pedobacter steynii]|uniref:Regulatory protein, luxR family n=1 Tax=Pedobacter steynii TaxID=430522 RepID=A0A1G9P667_9SPHI|nr:helix-turn-helix transcriptional regulator [Pedobacter steynii]NQX39078.1 LuxR family transcriptional regulator [Pedobacter steynii]SDL94382.1 regulatory protein, luxR family [Pedobacter steynii]